MKMRWSCHIELGNILLGVVKGAFFWLNQGIMDLIRLIMLIIVFKYFVLIGQHFNPDFMSTKGEFECHSLPEVKK